MAYQVNVALNQMNDRGRYGALFAQITEKLVREKSFPLHDGKRRQVDIVRDVINLVPVYFASTELVCSTCHRPVVIDKLILRAVAGAAHQNGSNSSRCYA